MILWGPNKAVLVSVQHYLYYSTSSIVVDFNSPKQDLRITVLSPLSGNDALLPHGPRLQLLLLKILLLNNLTWLIEKL